MKLVPLRQAQMKWLNVLKQKNLSSMSLWTYKKDRFVRFEKEGGQCFLVESGYVNQRVPLDAKTGKKTLKEAFGREFPRSTRLYIQED